MVILVVEDEAIIGYCLAFVLEEAGHIVLGPARSPGEALTLADGCPPELALIDIDLEDSGSGIQLARQLCTEHDCVVIFTTGCADAARANDDCAIGLLVKPYDPTELPALVSYAESTRRGARVAAPAQVRSFERFDRHPMWAPLGSNNESTPHTSVFTGSAASATRRADRLTRAS